jgi:hypothetical protein
LAGGIFDWICYFITGYLSTRHPRLLPLLASDTGRLSPDDEEEEKVFKCQHIDCY